MLKEKMQAIFARLPEAPHKQKTADLITVQLGFSAISFFYGLSLTFPPNQELHYVLYDAMRHYAPLWVWGVMGISVSLLHFAAYAYKRWLPLVFALILSGGFWGFVIFAAFTQGWYVGGGWSCIPHVCVYCVSAYRAAFWAKK